MENARHRRKACAVGCAWKTRWGATASGAIAGSSGPREDGGDVEGLGPEAEVSATESPDQD